MALRTESLYAPRHGRPRLDQAVLPGTCDVSTRRPLADRKQTSRTIVEYQSTLRRRIHMWALVTEHQIVSRHASACKVELTGSDWFGRRRCCDLRRGWCRRDVVLGGWGNSGDGTRRG